ncbi:MAG: undecaprenyl-diphosphate phosphatase [Patescibacteria group bacterium]|nr:undecaprenyl-diphosphate phosphatase [Patescibacteria group bacterium]
MDYIYSIIYGLVQGLTEFIPVSSSGHLVIMHQIFDFDFVSSLSFDVMLHAGTLVALLIYFYKDIIKYIGAFFNSLLKWQVKEKPNQLIAWMILIGTLPALVFGFFLEEIVENSLRSPLLVGLMLILVGYLFILFEKRTKKIKLLSESSFKSALIIGFFQVLALIPGTSRSGIAILGGLSQKLKRDQAARFAFLLAIPVTLGAVVKRSGRLLSSDLLTHEWVLMILAFLVAVIAGYLVIRFLLKFLKTHSLKVFAYYRFVLGIIILIYFLIN